MAEADPPSDDAWVAETHLLDTRDPSSESDMAWIAATYFAFEPFLANRRADEAPQETQDLSSEILDLVMYDPERAWPIIIELVDRSPNAEVLGWIAASLVEYIVKEHGELFLDRLEDRAIRSKAFHEALRGIWGWERFPKQVKDRLFAVVTPEWDDLADKRAALP